MNRSPTVGTRRSTGSRLWVRGLAAVVASGLAIAAPSAPAQAADAYFKDKQIRADRGLGAGRRL